MPRRPWPAAAMLATGASLVVTAQLAGAASAKRGGVFRIGTTSASVQVDPQLAYGITGWAYEYATAAKLLNYPDKTGPPGMILKPEVASRYVISNGGKRYTFFIRKGFRFSDGIPVTARHFKHAIDRAANHDLATPAAQFITDPQGTEIVGAKDVRDGNATSVRGVRVDGNRLVINLARPDGAFLSKITMPFFQATSTKLPLDQEVVNVDSVEDIPSAGPYALRLNRVNELTVYTRNPYWKRGPGRDRPRNLDGFSVQWNLNEQTAFNMLQRGELDLGPIPSACLDFCVPPEYGVNKTRFWAKSQNCTGFLALNMARPLFKNNLSLRRALNYAVNRRAYVAQAGPYAGRPWTRLLNPGVPGWSNVSPYPTYPDLSRARRLAAGKLRDGKVTLRYRASGTINPAQAQIVKQDFINIGFKSEDITMVGISGSGPPDPDPMRNADVGVNLGWCTSYPDPYDLFNNLLYGRRANEPYSVNYSKMNLPKWDRRMDAAAKLVGPERYKAYGQLDLDIMRQVAPIAVERTYNNRFFFSERVNPKSLVYQGIYMDFSIPALALKGD